MKQAGFIYLDTSLYLDILLGEPVAAKAHALLKNKVICSSTLLLLEAERNLTRLSREGHINPENFLKCRAKLLEDAETFILKELTAELCLTGLYPAVQTPRSSDMVHLRTALWFQHEEGIEGFATTDDRQSQAAAELALPLLDLKGK